MAFLEQGTAPFTALKWFGTLTGVIGALVLALNIPSVAGAGFFSVFRRRAGAIAGAVMRDYSLVVLQSAFLIVDVIGIWRWLII